MVLQTPPPGSNTASIASLQAQRLSVAFSNLGGLLKMQGRLAEAITCYERVATLQPQLPEVQARSRELLKCWFNTAALLASLIAMHRHTLHGARRCWRMTVAIVALELRILPASANIQLTTYLQANLAAVYKDAARHDAAIAAYTQALTLNAQFPEAFANLVHSMQSVCDWRGRGELFARLERDVRAALNADELPPVQPFHAMSYPFSADLVLEVRLVSGRGMFHHQHQSTAKSFFV